MSRPGDEAREAVQRGVTGEGKGGCAAAFLRCSADASGAPPRFRSNLCHPVIPYYNGPRYFIVERNAAMAKRVEEGIRWGGCARDWG